MMYVLNLKIIQASRYVDACQPLNYIKRRHRWEWDSIFQILMPAEEKLYGFNTRKQFITFSVSLANTSQKPSSTQQTKCYRTALAVPILVMKKRHLQILAYFNNFSRLFSCCICSICLLIFVQICQIVAPLSFRHGWELETLGSSKKINIEKQHQQGNFWQHFCPTLTRVFVAHKQQFDGFGTLNKSDIRKCAK